MADSKISALTATTSLADTDMLVVATAAGATKKITGASMRTQPASTLNGYAGILAPTSRMWQSGTVALTANRAYLARFVVPRTMTIVQISYYVSVAAGSDDAVDVGIYTVNGSGYDRLVSSGATTGKLNSTTGRKTVAIASTTLSVGTVYYAAFSSGTQGSTAASVTCTSYGTGINLMYGSTAGLIDSDWKNSSHALPSSLTSTSGSISNVPILSLEES